MSDCLMLSPTSDPGRFRTAQGQVLAAPEGWVCLPPGDAGLTRRVKAAGPSWQVIEKRGNKTFSRGLWAPAGNIAAARAALDRERATPAYARKRASDQRRRATEQETYVGEFTLAVLEYLNFAAEYAPLALTLAEKVAVHATPVGSGTVARTESIPVEARAAAAVIAWMRHQTTEYDDMKIARVKGRRREVRRELAQESKAVLDWHRAGGAHPSEGCPLCGVVGNTLAKS